MIYRSLERAALGGLYQPKRKIIVPGHLIELLLHGARFVYPASTGPDARGVPTAWAAPPLQRVVISGEETAPVWPDPLGDVRGMAVEPLHPAVPDAARHDRRLWELLALFDSIRIGVPRDRALAGEMLEQRIGEGEWA